MSSKVSGNGGRSYKRNSDPSDSSVSVSVITQHLSYLGDGSNALPNFPDIHFLDGLPEECSIDDVDTFKYVLAIINDLFSIVFIVDLFIENIWKPS